MKKSTNVNIVALGLKPTWEYPSMGNVLTDEPNQACAVVCDACIEKYYDEGFNDKIKFAVELQGGKVLYHDILNLEALEEERLSDAEIADRADAHNCYAQTHADDDNNLRCSNCDRVLQNADSEFRYKR
jgi:hypothetical protein